MLRLVALFECAAQTQRDMQHLRRGTAGAGRRNVKADLQFPFHESVAEPQDGSRLEEQLVVDRRCVVPVRQIIIPVTHIGQPPNQSGIDDVAAHPYGGLAECSPVAAVGIDTGFGERQFTGAGGTPIARTDVAFESSHVRGERQEAASANIAVDVLLRRALEHRKVAEDTDVLEQPVGPLNIDATRTKMHRTSDLTTMPQQRYVEGRCHIDRRTATQNRKTHGNAHGPAVAEKDRLGKQTILIDT